MFPVFLNKNLVASIRWKITSRYDETCINIDVGI